MKEFVNKQITRLEDEIELHDENLIQDEEADDDDDIEEMVAEVDFDVEGAPRSLEMRTIIILLLLTKIS